ncbi:hypothetical protein [Candidatus Bealeia paramacronuclearis]|uniref:hypothetical protein n=1 Tax=Candidatus Bealeia paramacronuclearis TaxID=1921001 RepID=UPI0030D25632
MSAQLIIATKILKDLNKGVFPLQKGHEISTNRAGEQASACFESAPQIPPMAKKSAIILKARPWANPERKHRPVS